MLNTLSYRVQKDHSFVHDLQMVGHMVVVSLELTDKGLHFVRLNFDNKTVTPGSVLG